MKACRVFEQVCSEASGDLGERKGAVGHESMVVIRFDKIQEGKNLIAGVRRLAFSRDS
jgi:hypothetical protein